MEGFMTTACVHRQQTYAGYALCRIKSKSNTYVMCLADRRLLAARSYPCLWTWGHATDYLKPEDWPAILVTPAGQQLHG